MNLIPAGELLGNWLADALHGAPPVRFQLASPFASFDVRPGRLILLGGPPGTGKTAALLQLGIDMLRLNESARLLVANVEMPPALLLERIAARLSGVPLSALHDRTLTGEQKERVQAAVDGLGAVADRLAFAGPPFALEHVAEAATAFDANVLVIDYVQRFTLAGQRQEQRERIESLVGVLRRFCDAGAAVLCAAAVARQKNAAGSTYRGLNLASFRGSSELEYGADACYLLVPDANGDGVTFTNEKNRYGPVADIAATFDPALQSFAPAVELSPLDRFDAATPAKAKKAKGG